MRDPEQPDPAMDATLRLRIGEPLAPSAEATQQLTVGEPVDPAGTQRLTLPAEATVKLVLPLLEADAGPSPDHPILNPGVPPVLVQTWTQPLPPLPKPRPIPWKLPAALAGLIALGAVVYLVLSRLPVPPPSASLPSPRPAVVVPHAGEVVSASVQAYIDRAAVGDVNAMRMLGAMYYNGLDVPRDPVKGLAWYRKAAEQGSMAARAELDKLEQARK
jgi:hypothetical protein